MRRLPSLEPKKLEGMPAAESFPPAKQSVRYSQAEMSASPKVEELPGLPQTPLDIILGNSYGPVIGAKNILQANREGGDFGRSAFATKAIFGRSLGSLREAPRPKASSEGDQVEALVRDALEHGYLHQASPFGELPVARVSSEHEVSFDDVRQRWIKATKPAGYGIVARVRGVDEIVQDNGTVADYLIRMLLQNEFYPTDIQIESVWRKPVRMGDEVVPGYSAIVISQRHVPDIGNVNVDTIRVNLKGMGWIEVRNIPVGHPNSLQFYNPARKVLVLDLKPDNVAIRETENREFLLYVIDAVIQFSTPELERALKNPRYQAP